MPPFTGGPLSSPTGLSCAHGGTCRLILDTTDILKVILLGLIDFILFIDCGKLTLQTF